MLVFRGVRLAESIGEETHYRAGDELVSSRYPPKQLVFTARRVEEERVLFDTPEPDTWGSRDEAAVKPENGKVRGGERLAGAAFGNNRKEGFLSSAGVDPCGGPLWC